MVGHLIGQICVGERRITEFLLKIVEDPAAKFKKRSGSHSSSGSFHDATVSAAHTGEAIGGVFQNARFSRVQDIEQVMVPLIFDEVTVNWLRSSMLSTAFNTLELCSQTSGG